MRRFEAGRPGPDAVAGLLELRVPAITRAALGYIAERLDADEPSAGWAPLIPSDVIGRPPEVIEAIAALHARGLPEAPMPDVRATVPLSVSIPWTRARLIAAWGRPGTAAGPGTLEPVATYAAVESIDWDRVPDPMRLLTTLIDVIRASSEMPSSMTRPIARALASMGRSGRLPGAVLAPALAELIPTPAADIALDALAEPWSVGAALPAAALREALDGVFADRAARAMAARGDQQALRAALDDDERPLRTHRAALRQVEADAAGAGPGALLARALAEPLYLAPAAFDALARLKTAGVRIAAGAVGAAFALYLAGPPMHADRIASTIGHADAVHHAIDLRLAEVPHDLRSLDLLAALPGGTARVIALLGDPAHRLLWTAALRHLAAERHRRGPGLAEAIAARLDARPVEAARALSAVIGAETIDLARRLPVRDALALRLRHRPDAVDWSTAAGEGAVDGAVLDRLPPALFGAARIDLETWAASAGHPLRAPAIRALGRLAGRASIPAIATALTEPEPIDAEGVAAVARGALSGIGARLAGRRLPAHGSHGRAMVEALGGLLPETRDPATLARLLDALAAAGPHDIGLAVRPALRHRDPDVRAAAARALAGSVEPAATDWLFSRVDDDDHRPLRAVYEALGARGDRRATPALIAGLEHPLMNLKKTAAEALRAAGDERAVPRLLFWLGRQDNPGFRGLLLDALRAVSADLGRLRGALDAAEAAGDRTRVGRLLPALDRRVPRARLDVWEATAPWADALRDADLEPADAAPPDAMDDGGDDRRARRRVLAWPIDATIEAPLDAIAYIALGVIDGPLFDRLWALYALPGAPRRLIRRHLARGHRLSATRRFAAICALRDATPADERSDAATTLAALGARPDEDERRRWAGVGETAGHARDARPAAALRQGHSDRGRGSTEADARLDLIGDTVRGRAASPTQLRLITRGMALGDMLYVGGRAAAVEAARAAHHSDAWPVDDALGGGPLGWVLDAALDALAGGRPVDRCAARDVDRFAPTERRVEHARRAAGDDRGARDALDRLGRLDLDARVAMVRAGDRPRGLAGEAALRVVLRTIGAPAQAASWWGRARRDGFTEPATIAWALRAAPPPVGCPSAAVEPHIAAGLRAGALDAVSRLPVDVVPGPMRVRALQRAEPASRFAARLRRHFAATARTGLIHAPGLFDALLAAPAALDAPGWRALLASTDAGTPAGRDRITAALRAHVEPAEAGARLVEALGEHPAAFQVPLLLPWRAVPAVEAQLARVLVDRDPAGRQLIPAALHTGLLARAVEDAGDHAPDTLKRVLSALVALDAPGTTDRLVAALDHRAPAVRAHAHRLLRRHAPTAVYLDATRRHLLTGRDAQTMRRAARVLSYAGHLPAVPGIVGHLSAGGPLAEAARAGLVYMGPPALGALHKALSKARPDRRAAIESVIVDIDAGLDRPEPDGAEPPNR